MIRWSPLQELSRLRGEIHRILGSPLAEWPDRASEVWGPATDLYEDSDGLTIQAELPGMRREDIDVSLRGESIVISGERKHEEERREGGSYQSERYFGRFERSIPLPYAVDESGVTATYRDGVLSIRLPKSEEAKRKQIQVKDA